jgi:pyruvate/2-oxoglutarate dehydrogenase complex dihydrolipoamide acyltransferase (E2) component
LKDGGGVVIVTTLKVPKTGGIPTTKASVLRWLKHEGDSVQVGEAIVELETEKVSYELESPIAGVLLKIVARESLQVPVGGPLCHIGQRGDPVPAEKG